MVHCVVENSRHGTKERQNNWFKAEEAMSTRRKMASTKISEKKKRQQAVNCGYRFQEVGVKKM